MGSVINITPHSYSEQEMAENWAGEFAKRIMETHKTSPVLDHPDGSVTEDKLSGGVKEMIFEAVEVAHTATETANTAKAVAQSAKASADSAVNEAENAYSKSLDADSKADNAVLIANTAKTKAESAEKRAISAETKSDAAVASASDAMEKSEKVEGDLIDYADQIAMSFSEVNLELATKVDKTEIITSDDTALSFEFSANHNTENRTGELTTISFTFGDGEYAEDYISGLSFDSGETPTAIDYTDSGILNWVGTDCTTFDGLSIFQPSANTHYDIVFYFNGVQFIGLVNGFIPATGNEAA